MANWLPWAPLASVILHISEEFVYPGGFPAWYRRYRADASRVTRRFLVIINALLVVVCLNIGTLGGTTIGVVYWLAITALLCTNGIWHGWASLRSHSYSPGMITGLLVYVPLATFGYWEFLRAGDVSMPTAILAAIAGASYQFWDALYHRSIRLVRKRTK